MDLLELASVPPSPAGALTIDIRCSTVGRDGPGQPHALTINADWTLATPHDLDLERIGAGLGGYLSCLDFADHTLPALRELVQLAERRQLPDMTRESTGRWRVRCDNCPNDHASAAFAADHARDVGHVARKYGLKQSALRNVYAAAGWRPARIAPRHEKVREFDGMERLWAAGIHPELVERLHDLLWSGGPPMPMRFYLGAIARRPDLSWVGKTISAVPDEDVAVWLCWTETELDRKHPDARAAWLSAGVPRPAILGLLAGAYTPADVARLVATSQRSVTTAATTFAGWVRAGCRPAVEDILLLDELDVDPFYAPSTGALDWLCPRVPSGITRTEVGLILAVCGNRRTTLRLIDFGVRDPRAALAYVRPEVIAQ